MLRQGKLPQETLAALLSRVHRPDPSVLLGPGIGRDAAILELDEEHVLVVTSDPVTFAAEDIGWYCVNVNANDVACMGARPAWFTATILLPEGGRDDLPRAIFDQLLAAADRLNVSLVGGHTEVTAGLDRPIVAGTMFGVARREDAIDGTGIRPGDAVVLAGRIAIEGTAILAREAPTELLEAAVPESTITRAQALLFDPGISVVEPALALCACTKPRLMHDPTEGGIATALHEIAAAAGATLRIDLATISLLDETSVICEKLGLDPLGLLASGALLAIVPAADVERVTKSSGAPSFRVIGRVEAGDQKVILEPEGAGAPVPLPMFDRDELARFFDGMAGGR